MCGLFGFAKREGWQSEAQLDRIEDVVTNLTWESVVRGDHSTGFAIVSKTDKMVYKTLKPSDQLVCSNKWYDVLEKIDADTTIFMGHVRFATTGAKTKENAHPFVKGSVIGAHNGVIYNHNAIASKIGKNVQVDSEVIFGLLNKKKKYQEVFDLLEGDFALSWIDDDYRVLNLMREEDRPLHVAYWKKARCLFWASTDDILLEALRMAGLVLESKVLPVDTVYEFNTAEFWKKPKVKETKVETNSNWTGYNSYSNYIDRDYYASSYSGYGSLESQCKFCGDKTYRTDQTCYKCTDKNGESLRLDKDGEWCADCVDCDNKTRFEDLTNTAKGYVCSTCINASSFSSYGGTSYNDRMNLRPCDYCGDYEPSEELAIFRGLSLCAYCESTEKAYRANGQTTPLAITGKAEDTK